MNHVKLVDFIYTLNRDVFIFVQTCLRLHRIIQKLKKKSQFLLLNDIAGLLHNIHVV